jgi:competence protein ComEA
MKFRSSSLMLGVLALALTASLSAAQNGTTAPAAAPAKAAAPAAKTTTAVSTTTAPSGTSTASMKSTTKTHMVAKPKLDLNSASKEDLAKLPGLTEDIADKIIAGRPYKSKVDLVKNKILTSAQYSKVRLMVIAKAAK